jgi:2-oxoglutarate ferredoxin oxidoreductase subunit beta
MTETLAQSFLGCSIDDDREFSMVDYEGAIARWCTGCGDHAIYTAVKRLLEAEQLPPEQTVFVSGIGCSSRFPHYFKTYGFHSLHGRALPLASSTSSWPRVTAIAARSGQGIGCIRRVTIPTWS